MSESLFKDILALLVMVGSTLATCLLIDPLDRLKER